MHWWLKYRTVAQFRPGFSSSFLQKKGKQLFQQTAPGFPSMCVSGMMHATSQSGGHPSDRRK